MNRFKTWYYTRPPVFRTLVAINVVFYLVWILLLSHIGATHRFVAEHLALNPDLPGILFEPWQLITYSFLHLEGGLGGLLHIFFNMYILYWVAPDHEELRGGQSLLALYLLGSVGGGLLSVLVQPLLPAAFIHGASASVLAVLAGVATFNPQKRIGLLFLGPVRLPYIVAGFLVLDVLFMGGSTTAVAAHLGGALAGFLFARGEMRGIDLSSWTSFLLGGGGKRKTASRSPSTRPSWFGKRSTESASSGARMQQEPLTAERIDTDQSDEVDRILDKISEEGYEALTKKEKQILYEASQK